MSNRSRMSRRRVLQLGATATALPLVHVRGAHAAGKLSLGIVDHWVKAANGVIRQQIDTWAAANKVEIQLDFITAIGNKDLLTSAAEAQARQGHDIRQFYDWGVQQYADRLVPMDDLVKRVSAKYGAPPSMCKYLVSYQDSWRAVPTGTMSKYVVSSARLDIFRDQCGIDLQAMYPAQAVHTPAQDQWDWDHFLVAAQKCQAAGKPFGLAVANTPDSVEWIGALFAAYDAQLVAADGTITVKTDKVRQVMDYAVRLMKFLPAGVYGWDGGSNNRALISGQSALIFEAPSAWSVATTDAPAVGAQCWNFPNPKGPAGRFVPYTTQFWGVWEFSPNKSAALDLLEYLLQREQVEPRTNASNGYDITPYPAMADFKIWEQAGPPPGTLYNYPIRPTHDAQPCMAGYPAPPSIGVQMFQNGLLPLMIARVAQAGHSVEDTLDWASQELEGYSRG